MAIRIWVEAAGKCHWCGESLEPEEASFDHYMPLGLGGSDGIENIVLACAPCNLSKGNLHPRVAELWMREGLPRCWALEIFAFEQGQERPGDCFFTLATFEELEGGKHRMVEPPLAGSSCDNPRCPDCAMEVS